MSEKIKSFKPSRQVRHESFHEGTVHHRLRYLAEETALEIIINGLSYSLLMQTPGQEAELVTGFLYTEGLIDAPSQIGSLTIQKGAGILGMNGVEARVRLPELESRDALPERISFSLSSCGLCGKESLDQIGRGIERVKSRQHFSWETISGLLTDLRRRQPLYEQTKGVHAAAVYEADGSFVCCFEDVGRHNALDKVIGYCLRHDVIFHDKLVVLSGRASLEMILKTARAGMPLFLCFSSPTTLAIEAAKSLNITLVGREKDRTLAAYTHTRRLELKPE
ncbi:MAG: formate dehydrogenase accessory sulfurtransferase FdhD [Deltaproteobacteria bacterium]|nr:formate dehydrogenase accessory sulfurtransferase FdhD [Deltaproteobacteria bacterium]